MNPGQYILITAIRLYRCTLSPLQGLVFGPLARCRFSPTCSEYAMQAIRAHGALTGSWLGLKRICRCNPWGGCGHDPVPPVKPRPPRREQQHRSRLAAAGFALHDH